jgi:hypothetical protein
MMISTSEIAMESRVSSFVQAGVRVDDQDIQVQAADQTLETVVEQSNIVAFAQDAGDLAGFDAGRD